MVIVQGIKLKCQFSTIVPFETLFGIARIILLSISNYHVNDKVIVHVLMGLMEVTVRTLLSFKKLMLGASGWPQSVKHPDPGFQIKS